MRVGASLSYEPAYFLRRHLRDARIAQCNAGVPSFGQGLL